MDGTAQSVDPCFVLQSMDCPLIPWIAQTEGRKAWIQAIELNVAWIRQSCGSFTKGARSRCSWPVLCTRARRVVCACAYRPRNRKYAVYLYKQFTQCLDLRSSTTCHHFAPVLLLLYESIPLERFSVNHGRRSWRVSQLADRQNSLSPRLMPRTCVHENARAIIAHSGVCAIALARALLVEQSMDCPREAWIHALRSSIHGLSESMLCAQHM